MLFSLFAFAGLLQQITAQFPQSNVTCSGTIKPQGSVPTGSGLSVMQGVWYVRTTFQGCNCDENYCTQVIVGDAPYDITVDMTTNLTYSFSYMKNDPVTGTLTTGSAGTLVPTNLDTANPAAGPPFVLILDLTDFGIPLQFTDFYFIAAEYNDFDELTTVATYSCPQEGTLGDAQIFYWTRQPYFESPSTFASINAKAAKAIQTYNDFTLQPVFQAEDYCYYSLGATNGGQTQELVCDESFTMKVSNAAAWGSFLTLFLLIGLTAFICNGAKGGDGSVNTFQKMTG